MNNHLQIFIFLFFLILTGTSFAEVREIKGNEKKAYDHLTMPKFDQVPYSSIQTIRGICKGSDSSNSVAYKTSINTFDAAVSCIVNRSGYEKHMRRYIDKKAENHCRKNNRKALYRGKGNDNGAGAAYKTALGIVSFGLGLLEPEVIAISYVCERNEDPYLLATANEKKKIENEKIQEENKKKEKRSKFNDDFALILIDLDNLNLCRLALNTDGKYLRHQLFPRIVDSFDVKLELLDYSTAEVFENELRKRELFKDRNYELEKCNKLTGIYTDKQKNTLNRLKAKELAKVEMINGYKKDCSSLGFKANTEGMGNCVLKLLELGSKGSAFNNSNPETNESLKLEREKIAIERKKLEALIEQAEADKLQAYEAKRQADALAAKNRQDNFNRSLDNLKGLSCYYGNTWDCY